MSDDIEIGRPSTSNARTLEVLLEQYKLLESRRTSFGREFMQTLGFVLAVFGGVVGLLGASSPLLHPVMRVTGGVLLLLAALNYRLGKRQDHCEKAMAEVEVMIEDALGAKIARMPQAARVGARLAIVTALVVAGCTLIFTPPQQNLWAPSGCGRSPRL